MAVIGGGASGWSAVRALEEANGPEIVFETTIFEKEKRWGGKCCTIIPDEVSRSGNDSSPGIIPTDPNKRKYELGAGVVSGSFSKPTENYAEILKIIKGLGFGISLVERTDRRNYVFFKNGQEQNITSFRIIFRNIRHFLKAKYDIWKNYTSNTLNYKDMLAKHPLLTQHLSYRYPNQAVLEALAKAGQGYGYGDQDDPYLAAPLLYFLDFIKSEQEKALLYSVKQGMQEIWSKTAEGYHQGVQQRLGENVTHIKRGNSVVTIKTNRSNNADQFDKLVIATPLKQAQNFMDYSEQEQLFLGKVKYNHYVSVFCKVDVEKDALGFVHVSKTVDRSKLGQVVFSYKPYSDSPWMINYLYLAKGTTLSDDKIVDQVAKNLREELNAKLLDKESAIIRHWEDYFAHLDREGLESGWYETFDKDFQNQKNTLYVGTPLHMDSVGQSVRYAFNTTQKVIKDWIKERENRIV